MDGDPWHRSLSSCGGWACAVSMDVWGVDIKQRGKKCEGLFVPALIRTQGLVAHLAGAKWSFHTWVEGKALALP